MTLIRSRRATSVEILLSSAVLAGLVTGLGTAAGGLLELGQDFALRALAIFLVVVLIVWFMATRQTALAGFGAANRVTLSRVALMALVAAALGEVPDDILSWGIIGVTTTALILDGIDGRIARRTGSSSTFGARFDMETDAALILVLSILCWQFDKAGPWILAAGGMRYAFVLAVRLLPWMNAPLPPSRRRQTVCILQSAGLLGVISPVFPWPASAVLAGATLIMLAASFGLDIRWLWNRRRTLSRSDCA